MKLTAIYARVSTARQEQEHTIKTQLSAINELVQTRGLKVVKEYKDDGWSGDVLARPALDQLRQEASAKVWQVLVVYDPDRLARRYSYQELVMDELREAGIEIVFVTVAAPKNSEEKILHGVRGLFAEYERAKITERLRLGRLRKIKEGHIIASEPLYGYRYVPKQDQTPGYYEVEESEARVVRMIFDWVDREGLTLGRVIKRLQERGIKPRKSKRGVWAHSTISHLLRNQGYVGKARWASSYAVIADHPTSTEKYRKNRKTSRRIKPENEWLIVPVPAIIEENVFARVQKRLKANFLFSPRNTNHEYLLAGKIYCVCGRRRGAEGKKGKYLYYRCLDRTLSFPLPRVCKERVIDARIADRLVWNEIVNLMRRPNLMKEQICRWQRDQGKQAESSGEDVQVMQREIAKLKDQEDRYNKAYGSGLFTLEQLREYTLPIREKIASLHSQISKAKQTERASDSVSLPTGQEVEAFANQAIAAFANLRFETKQQIMRSVVDKVVGTREKLTIYGILSVPSVEVCPNAKTRQDTPRNKNGEVCTNAIGRQGTPRHKDVEVCLNAKRRDLLGHGFDRESIKRIPFQLEIDLLNAKHVQN